MYRPLPPARTAAELEARAGVHSLDELHQRRREIMLELAPLEALYGPGGLFTETRHVLRAALATEIRAADQASLDGTRKPLTDGKIEDMAMANPRYAARIAEAVLERVRYLELVMERTEIEELIDSRKMGLLSYNAEIKLQ